MLRHALWRCAAFLVRHVRRHVLCIRQKASTPCSRAVSHCVSTHTSCRDVAAHGPYRTGQPRKPCPRTVYHNMVVHRAPSGMLWCTKPWGTPHSARVASRNAVAHTHAPLPASFRCRTQTREGTDLRSLQRAKMEREGYARVKSSKGGTERLEVKLDGRKHRRQSRQSARQASEQQD